MAGPLTSPWAPPEGRLQDAFRIADMIRDTGRIEAQGKYNRRMAVSDLVGGIAGTAFDMIDANQQKKALQEIGAILASGQPFDAQALVAKYGIKATKEAYSLYSAMQPKPDTFSSVDPEKDLINDRTGEIMRKGRPKEPTAAEQREAEKYAKEQRDESVEAQMAEWVDTAKRAGVNFEDIESQYFRETRKAVPASLQPKTPTEAEWVARAAQGDPVAIATVKALKEFKDNSQANPTEASMAWAAAGGDPIKALEYMRNQRARAGGTAAGSDGDLTQEQLQALMANIDKNPALWDSLTPTTRTALAVAGYSGQGKPLTNSAIVKISESKTGLAALRDLRSVVVANEQYIGPASGLQSLNPWSDAKKAKADMDRVRQRVGKALEGGVLREADERKYKEILATLFDTPSTAIYKIDQLLEDVQRDVDIFIEEQRAAGRRVGTAAEVPDRTLTPPPAAPVAPAPGTLNRGGGLFGTRTRRGGAAPAAVAPVAPVAPGVAPVAPPVAAPAAPTSRRRQSPPTVGALVGPPAAPPPVVAPPAVPPREGFARSYDTPAPARPGPQVPPRVPIPPPPEVAALLKDQPPGIHELSDGSVWRKMPNGTLMRLE